MKRSTVDAVWLRYLIPQLKQHTSQSPRLSRRMARDGVIDQVVLIVRRSGEGAAFLHRDPRPARIARPRVRLSGAVLSDQ